MSMWGEKVQLRQAWQAVHDPGFGAGSVWFRITRQVVSVRAALDDNDIFNDATAFNQPLFQLGDAFEMFFRPVRQKAYVELHVGPGNQQFQLKISSSELFAAQRNKHESWRRWIIPGPPCFESRTRIEPGRWWVEARIPVSVIAEKPVQAGDLWLYSFSRYDYTRGQARPILSSSSPHTRLDFHDQTAWQRAGVVS